MTSKDTSSKRISRDLTREQCNRLYDQVLRENDTKAQHELCLHDLFYMMTRARNRRDADKPWIYERCREVEEFPDGYLDLWAREHYKSSIITQTLTEQDILRDPEITIGVFSFDNPNAKKFLKVIKRDFEENTYLQDLFPDILYKNPQAESSCWSIDNGIIVKRKTNPREPTLEASGLTEGQPTGAHYKLMVYDDVVTRESVTTPEQIKKTTAAWALSLSLGSEGGRFRYIGTRYHFNDTYKAIIESGLVKLRIYKATDDGTVNGKPVLFTQEYLDQKKAAGMYTFGCQYLQDPKADAAMGFKEDWLMYYGLKMKPQDIPDDWNVYILVDPSSGKKTATSNNLDYTAMEVWGMAPDGNDYLIDGIRDRMNPTQRIKKLFSLVMMYRPQGVGYEEYGMQADIHFIEKEMDRRKYHFEITALGGNKLSKEDRISVLIPLFENHRVWLPYSLVFIDREGKAVDFVKQFVNDEYLAFPVPVHDDMLDCAARLHDPKFNAVYPRGDEDQRGGGVTIIRASRSDPTARRSSGNNVASGQQIVINNSQQVLRSRYAG